MPSVCDLGSGEVIDAERVYRNAGNAPLIGLLSGGCCRILDVGCGAGDNSALIKTARPDCEIYGITHSLAECRLASRWMADCWIFDIEKPLPADIAYPQFDALIFSHVLEHVRDPAVVLARFLELLREGGEVLIAVPNILSWRTRFKFLCGRFEYESSGPLDDTHLRFFTYLTAERYLLSSEAVEPLDKTVSGSVPLWWLRRHLFPTAWSKRIDEWGCRHWPNLFGDQVLLKARKRQKRREPKAAATSRP